MHRIACKENGARQAQNTKTGRNKMQLVHTVWGLYLQNMQVENPRKGFGGQLFVRS